MQVGTLVRHVDGSIGVVTAIHDGKPGERLIEWKGCGKYRVSGEAALKQADPKAYRWRKSQ